MLRPVLKELYKKSRFKFLCKIAIDINENISLTKIEQDIFDLLKQVIKDKSPGSTLRVAGGWMRDKLLGIPSHDIDIAVDNISGYKFALLALEWMKEHNIPGLKQVAKVDENPEQSKHIETAILPIFGIPIDFVQLRKETYSENSRIPQVEATSSAQEDALRRDLTINSLFYNINNSEVEDFVGGIEDLKKGIARTPIDSKITFIQDPLRVLRTLRFAIKYGLDLDPAVKEAIKDPEVQSALKSKVSKERIWKELVGTKEPQGWKKGLLSGPNPHLAAKLLAELGLRDLLFGLSEEEQQEIGLEKGTIPWDSDQNNPHHNLNIWEHTLAAMEHLHDAAEEIDKGEQNKELEGAIRNLSMLLHDIGKCDLCSRQDTPQGHYTYHGHAESSAKMAEFILRNNFKAPEAIIKRVVALCKHHMRLHTLPADAQDKTLRKVLKDIGDDWRNLVFMSISDSMGKTNAVEDNKYREFAKRIDEYLNQTGGKIEIKPPITGNDIMTILGLKPGAEVGRITKALKDKLLEIPGMSKEEAVAFIKSL